MTESIKVFLTSAQKNKLSSGKTFQLSSHQLQAGQGKHSVEIQMSKKNHRQLLKNVSHNKGFRFSPDKIEGSGIFGNIAKSVAKAVAPKILDKVGEYTGQSGITNALKKSSDDLIDVAADKITGGKLKKGTPEMKAHMARLRGMRKIKGGNVFDDIGRKIKKGFTDTFNPALGDKIKNALTSSEAKQVYSGIAAAGATALTGNPLAGAVAGEAVGALSGAGVKRRYKKRNLLVVGGTLVAGAAYPQLRVMGKGFTSSKGTHYGGSFASPTRGGSFVSP